MYNIYIYYKNIYVVTKADVKIIYEVAVFVLVLSSYFALHFSHHIYLLFVPSNMDFKDRNFGLQFARVALVDSEGNCPGVGRLSGGQLSGVNYPGKQFSRGAIVRREIIREAIVLFRFYLY